MNAKADTINRLCRSSAEDVEEVECPSCNKKLQSYEVALHFQQEVERLRQAQTESVSDVVTPPAANGTEGEAGEDRRKPWVVFRRVQRNRQSRLKQRTRKQRPTPPPQFACPVCNKHYAQSEIQRHTEQCLRRTNGRDDNSSNEEEDGDEYEEYEWAGQKRIRVSSLLQGGYASIGIGQATSATVNNSSQQADDEDEDLNVDEDDTHVYGPAQFGESDVIVPTEELQNGSNAGHEDNNVTNYMRRLIASTNQTVAQSEVPETAQAANYCIPNDEGDQTQAQNREASEFPSANSSGSVTVLQQQQQIIDALKAKLRLCENQVQGKFKCLICLDDYRNPAISVSCWHVHCEQCWLRSLGARKLCPQCNLITTPKDLRRIYM